MVWYGRMASTSTAGEVERAEEVVGEESVLERRREVIFKLLVFFCRLILCTFRNGYTV